MCVNYRTKKLQHRSSRRSCSRRSSRLRRLSSLLHIILIILFSHFFFSFISCVDFFCFVEGTRNQCVTTLVSYVCIKTINQSTNQQQHQQNQRRKKIQQHQQQQRKSNAKSGPHRIFCRLPQRGNEPPSAGSRERPYAPHRPRHGFREPCGRYIT